MLNNIMNKTKNIETEAVRLYLVETAKKLAEIAESKEEARLNLVETAKKLAEIASETKFNLYESREKYAIIFDQSPIAIEYFNERGELVSVNKACIDLFGVVDRNDVVGSKLFDDPNISSVIKTKLAAKETVRFESPFDFSKVKKANLYQTTKSGTLYLDWSITPLMLNREILGYIEQIQDITERVKREEKAKELDRLKDMFLTTSSHELRSPLVPIVAQAQMLLDNAYGVLKQNQRDAVDMIIRNAKTLSNLTSDTLDIALIRSNQLKLIFEKVSFGNLVTEVINNYKIQAQEKNIEILLDPLLVEPHISVDKLRICQVMNNLLSNALKFTNENGKVEVRVIRGDTEIVVKVKDTGIGISPHQQSELFTPFFQIDGELNRKYPGTGLGLSITKGIIEGHGGRIWLESKGLGKGTMVSFSIPIIN